MYTPISIPRLEQSRAPFPEQTIGLYSEIRITKGKDADGNRIFVYIAFRGTEEDAEAERIRRLNDLNQGAYIEHSKITVSEFLDQWLSTYAEGNVGQITLEGYKSMIENHLKPSFGALPLQKLLPFVIQNHYAKLMKDGGRKDGRKGPLSRTTVMHQHRLLSEALAMAVRWQLLPRNPCDAVTPPRLDPREVQAIDETTTAWLIEAGQGTRLYLPIFMVTSAGMRRGEILAAVWSNVDERNGTLRIDRALSETKEKGVFFKKPKGRRTHTVALPPLLLEAMKPHREEQDKHREMLGTAYCENDLICCRPDGSIWAPSAFTSAYRPAPQAAGAEQAKFSRPQARPREPVLGRWRRYQNREFPVGPQQSLVHAGAVLPPHARAGSGSRRAH
ncbi:MAG: tyrosine-type recombinase/integrase family protein [Bryobacterales bacterium]|nr:tyrosine-type recombinase/integrase family protein [Bryobacterales bacterium]